MSSISESLWHRGNSESGPSGPGPLFPHRTKTPEEEEAAKGIRAMRAKLLSQNRGRESSLADTLRRAEDILRAGPSLTGKPTLPPGATQEMKDLAARAARMAFDEYASSSARGSADPPPASMDPEAVPWPGTGS